MNAEPRWAASRSLPELAESMESLAAVPTYCGTAKPGAAPEPFDSARGRPAADGRLFQGARWRGPEVLPARAARRFLKRFLVAGAVITSVVLRVVLDLSTCSARRR
jgi:hypothetical protein